MAQHSNYAKDRDLMMEAYGSVQGNVHSEDGEHAEDNEGMFESGKIRAIVHDYSEYGVIDEVDEMIEDIKKAILQELKDLDNFDDVHRAITNL